MNINFFFEMILILLAILASNLFIFILPFINYKTQNSCENLSVLTNNSGKDVLAQTLLIASNPLSLTSSESSASQTLSASSSETYVSQDFIDLDELDLQEVILAQSNNSNFLTANEVLMAPNNNLNISTANEVLMAQSNNSNFSTANEVLMANSPYTNISASYEGMIFTNINNTDQFTTLDSYTILNSQTIGEWREIALEWQDFPLNTPAHILQQIKFEELNILYSQDLIHYAITQTELRLIIELIPAISLFKPEINHFILTIMAYYHL